MSCYFASQVKRTRNGVVEDVFGATFRPPPPPPPPTVPCRHCTSTFLDTQALRMHVKIAHPLAMAHVGIELKLGLRSAGPPAVMPWDGKGLGRCWVVRFNHTTKGYGSGRRIAGSVTLRIQPLQKTEGCSELSLEQSDGFKADPKIAEHKKVAGRRGAATRDRYTSRQKIRVVEELRELKARGEEPTRVFGMTPLKYLSEKVNIPASNISKWQNQECWNFGA